MSVLCPERGEGGFSFATAEKHIQFKINFECFAPERGCKRGFMNRRFNLFFKRRHLPISQSLRHFARAVELPSEGDDAAAR